MRLGCWRSLVCPFISPSCLSLWGGGVVGATTRGSFWKRLRVVLGISTKGMLRGLRCWCPLLTQPFKSLGSLSASAVPRVLGQVLP